MFDWFGNQSTRVAKSSDTVHLIGRVFIQFQLGFELNKMKPSLLLVIKEFGVSKSSFFSAIHPLQNNLTWFTVSHLEFQIGLTQSPRDQVPCAFHT